MELHIPKALSFALMFKWGTKYFSGLEEGVYRNIFYDSLLKHEIFPRSFCSEGLVTYNHEHNNIDNWASKSHFLYKGLGLITEMAD